LACLGRQRSRQQGEEKRQSQAGAPAAADDFPGAPGHLAVAPGTGNDFLPPIGHQSTTLVMGPGGRRFGDYWHLGLRLSPLVAGFGGSIDPDLPAPQLRLGISAAYSR
jgi:hypothetical protein